MLMSQRLVSMVHLYFYHRDMSSDTYIWEADPGGVFRFKSKLLRAAEDEPFVRAQRKTTAL